MRAGGRGGEVSWLVQFLAMWGRGKGASGRVDRES